MAWTARKKAEFRGLWLRGISVPQIAQTLGVSESSVKYHRRSLGLEPRKGTRPHKVRVGLTPEEFILLRQKAKTAGQPVATRIRHLILEDLTKP